jgi:serine/threonine protein kinase/Flp pilus assembly protein TadD
MDQTTSQRAKEIFLALADNTPAEEWGKRLDEMCAGDTGLQQRVRALLRAHADPKSYLDQPAVDLTLDSDKSRQIAEGPGSVIGPYKLIEEIGEGGMGAVWMAQQTEPVKRLVALKLIKPGMDSRQVIARFEAERQALALMDHPHIAKVLDAGTTEAGRPYFVMELVKGLPLTKYCDDHRLTPRQRLELFIAVCQAVQHAHQKGIIHRDLKPTNVLVALYDGKPVPKVIDFGVAKAAGPSLTDKTLVTGFGAIVGTLEYMSPEQAQINQLDIDTRSDIYSLGVLLYELLAGSPPFSRKELEKAGMLEMLRVIREQEPSKPSTKLSTAEGLPTLAANRGTEPAKLTKLVRGELDWIVMKALEKDRNRRYETANAFAADLLHYLRDEPVQACPPSAAYRFGKSARRNRAVITTAALVAAALVLGTVVSTWQAFRADAERSEAQKQKKLAEDNFQKARKAVDEYFTLVSESKLLDVPGMQPLRKELLEAALRYYQAMRNERADDPAVLADLVVAQLHVANVYHELDRNDDGLAATELAVTLAERLRRDYPDAVEQHRRLAGYWKVHRGTSSSTQMPKDPVAAHRTLTKFLQLWETFARENPSVEAFQNDVAAINNLLAALEGSRGATGEPVAFTRAIAYGSKAIAIWEQLSHVHPDIRGHRENLARAYDEIAWQFGRAGKQDEAREASAQAAALQEKLIAQFPDVPTYRVLDARKLVQVAAGLAYSRPREAEETFRQALQAWQKLAFDFPAAHEYTVEFARAQIRFAEVLASPLKRPDDAIRVFREGNEKLKKLAAEFPAELRYRRDLATAPRGLASRLSNLRLRLGDAEKLHLQSLAAVNELAKEFPKEPEYVEMAGHSYRYLGWTARDTGRLADAVAYFEKGVAAFQKLADADIPQKDGYYRGYEADTLKELALVLTAGGHVQEAETAYRRAISLREPLTKASQERRLAQANNYNDLSMLLMSAKRHHEAEEASRQAIKLKQALVSEFPEKPEYRFHLAHSYLGLCYVLDDSGRRPDAVQAASEADRLLKGLAVDASALAVLRENLGHTLWQLGETWTRLNRSEDALRAIQTALESFQQLAADHPENLYYRQEQGFSHRKLADLMEQNGRSKDAEPQLRAAADCYQKLVAESPDSTFYRQEAAIVDAGLANLLLRTGQSDEAEKTFRRSIETYESLMRDFPQNADYRQRAAFEVRLLAELFTQQKQVPGASIEWDKAADEYTKAIELKPDDWESWSGRAFVHFHREQWDQAVSDFSKAIELAPHVHTNWFHRGHAFLNLAQWDKARADFAKVVDQWPNDPEGWYHRGVAYAQLNQPDKAVADLHQAIEKGFKGELIKNDPRLAPLRSNDDFKKLLTMFEKEKK